MKLLMQSARGLSLSSLIALVGCGADPGNDIESSSELGEVQLTVTTVPTGVQCIQIVATGSSTVTKTFTVTAGSSSTNSLSLGNLPTGNVSIVGKAFNVACSGISGQTATWLSDSLSLNVQAGVITSPTITFRPNNSVTATATFVGNVVQVAASGNAIYVVYSDGTVRAAGNLASLGMGTVSTFTTVSSLTNVASLAVGYYDYGCALLKTGTVSCWGRNNEGELGNGTTTTTTAPVSVSGLSSVTQISAGDEHVCAVKSDNTVWCWGYNWSGQVGNGSKVNATTPVQVDYHATSVAAGSDHTCANAYGNVECWGNNERGQLGDGTTTSSSTPTSLYELSGVVQVAVGIFHSCALRANGDVFCWGFNNFGQSGDGTTSQLNQPSNIPTLTNVQQLTTTRYGTCALQKSGYVLCWGYDAHGEAGDGTGSSQILFPTYVYNNYNTFTNLFQGNGWTNCGIGSDQKAYCWGTNAAGMFGNGSTLEAWVPKAIGI